MDALQELINELIQPDVDLVGALMRARVHTVDLPSPELDEWIDSELGGYSAPEEVPEYRRFSVESYGDYAGAASSAGPSEGTVTDLHIRTDSLPERVKEFAESLAVLDRVAALQDHGAEGYRRPWPPEMVEEALEATARQGGLFLIKAYQYIPASEYSSILEQVRNRLFNSLLQIQSNSRTLEEGGEPEAAGGSVTVHVHGDGNVIAAGQQVSQQVGDVARNDMASLLVYLRENGSERTTFGSWTTLSPRSPRPRTETSGRGWERGWGI